MIISGRIKRTRDAQLTLHIGNALGEDLLENLGALKLLLDLADDGVGKLLLLALLNLALVADPRVQNLLGLVGQGSTLLELVGLSLELGGFLNPCQRPLFDSLWQENLGQKSRKHEVKLPWKQRRAAWSGQQRRTAPERW